MSEETARDRFVGCLLGLAVGDALGAPYEATIPSATPEEICAAYLPIRANRLPPGRWAGSAQLAMETVRVFLDEGGVEPKAVAKAFGRLLQRGIALRWGRATFKTIGSMVYYKKRWDRVANGPGSAGNTPAIRCIPLGLWHARAPGLIPEDARRLSSITHKDRRTVAGTAAVAAAVAHAVNAARLDAASLLVDVVDAVDPIHPEFGNVIGDVVMLRELPRETAEQMIVALGQKGPFEGTYAGAITGYILPTVMIGLYHVVQNPGDFVQQVGRTIATGGDTAATGALAGALAGAFGGASAIPEHLRRDLCDADEVVELAGAMSEAAMGSRL